MRIWLRAAARFSKVLGVALGVSSPGTALLVLGVALIARFLTRPTTANSPSEKCLSSWVGVCPGEDESAGVNYSHRSPQGNHHTRRLLNQSANAAARTRGSIFEIVYRRSIPRLGHNQAIGAIAHRLCRLIWLILHLEPVTKNGAQRSPNDRSNSAHGR
jgi:transposase